MRIDISALHANRWHLAWACLFILIAGCIGSFLLGRFPFHGASCRPAITDRNGITLVESVNTREGTVRYQSSGQIYCPLLAGVERDIQSGNKRRDGRDIRLTIDLEIQKILLKECVESFRSNHPEAIEAFISDPTSGEVLAAVSIKEDPESTLFPEELIPGGLFGFVPGSTFKPFTVAAYMEAFPSKKSDPIDCLEGKLPLGNGVILDKKPSGELTPEEILLHLSNVGISRMADFIGDEHFCLQVSKYGFRQSSGEFPEDSEGKINTSADDSENLQLAYLAIGHEIIVTPLQLAMAYGAIANGGTLMPARILFSKKTIPSQSKTIFSENTARFLQNTLKKAVAGDYGAGLARVDGIEVAGLPGTSQFSPPPAQYGNKNVYASFAGFFPAEHPRFVCLVVVKGADIVPSFNYGSVVAAPIFSQIARKVIPKNASSGDDKKSQLSNGHQKIAFQTSL